MYIILVYLKYRMFGQLGCKGLTPKTLVTTPDSLLLFPCWHSNKISLDNYSVYATVFIRSANVTFFETEKNFLTSSAISHNFNQGICFCSWWVCSLILWTHADDAVKPLKCTSVSFQCIWCKYDKIMSVDVIKQLLLVHCLSSYGWTCEVAT